MAGRAAVEPGEVVRWRTPSERQRRKTPATAATRPQLATGDSTTDSTSLFGASRSIEQTPTANGSGSQPTGGSAEATGTIQTLCPEDKARVARLIAELGTVSTEKRHKVAELAVTRRKFEAELASLTQKQQDAIRRNCDLEERLAASETQLAAFREQLSTIGSQAGGGGGPDESRWSAQSTIEQASRFGPETLRCEPFSTKSSEVNHPLSSTERHDALGNSQLDDTVDMGGIGENEWSGGKDAPPPPRLTRTTTAERLSPSLPPDITVHGVRYIPEFSVLSHSRVVVNPQRATADAAVSVTEPLLPTPVAVSTSTVGVQCEILSTHKPQLSNVGLRAESHNHNFDKQQHSHVNSGQTFDTTWGRRDVHSWQIPMTQPWHNQGKHGYANSAAPPPEPFAPPPQTRAFENTSPLGNSLGEAVAISFALNEL